MDESFYDMKIPRRPSEQPCPEDLAIHFAFLKDRSMLRLDLHGASMPLQYGGKGRILLENGFCRFVPMRAVVWETVSEIFRRFVRELRWKADYRFMAPRRQILMIGLKHGFLPGKRHDRGDQYDCK